MRPVLDILVVAIVSALLSGCGLVEETICREKEGQDRNGLVYLPNQQEPFTGKNLCKYENGQFKVEGHYKDGEQDGKWTLWHANGQMHTEGHYKDGVLDGKWIWWLENGQISKEQIYKDGRRVD